MQFVFPRTKYVDEASIPQQIEKLKEELNELEKAYYEEPNFNRFAEETLDLHQALETLERKIQEQRGINLHEVRREVESKNYLRGYYGIQG